jgi:hypothetical protein
MTTAQDITTARNTGTRIRIRTLIPTRMMQALRSGTKPRSRIGGL